MPNGDIVIVIGGDGTFYSAIKERYKDNPAFVLLNSGNLGFYAEFDYSDASEFVQMLADNNYDVVEYPIYEVEIVQKNGSTRTELFINDVSIERRSPKIIHMVAEINDKYSIPFACDSIVIASTLGSTAYSMSGNGALFLNHIPTFQITPVGQARNPIFKGLYNSVIVEDNSRIQFMPSIKTKRSFGLVCDGKEISIRDAQMIRIVNRGKTFRMIRSKNFDYANHIKNKLF